MTAPPIIGMYVHQHWGYRRPYAARAWTLADWRGYIAGLSALGYNTVMVWPMLETLPDPLTPSDVAHLEKMRAVIELLHARGMTALITMGPNVIGNAAAADYTFEDRPYFRCDRRLNPADPADMATLYRIRGAIFRDYLHAADGFVMIDSDPGGWIGSGNQEFVDLLRHHLALIAETNPAAYLYYWMWMGWENYNQFWAEALAGHTRYDWEAIAPTCEATVRLLLQHPEERWRLFCCMDDRHKPLVRALGVQSRTLYNPYGLVELEPAVPLTSFSPAQICQGLAQYERELTPLGVFANAQTHVTQLPNTYAFAHFAKGGTEETLDVAGFAGELFPHGGPLLAEAWTAMATAEPAKLRTLATALAHADVRGADHGRFAGLLFGDPQRYLADLALMLQFRAALLDARAAADADHTPRRNALCAVVATWQAWQQQTGYADAYYGPVADLLHPLLRKLNDPAINQALKDNGEFTTPELRHGVIPRLLAAIEAYLARQT